MTNPCLYVTIGYVTARDFRRIRETELKLTQEELALRLGLSRLSVLRYENGQRRIPGSLAIALEHLVTERQSAGHLPLVGTVAAGTPIEPIAQREEIEIPPSMRGRGEVFALRVKGTSMRDEGILPGDVLIVQKRVTAENGQTVVALVDGEATVKKYYRKADRIELHPANETMAPIIVRQHQQFQIEGIVTGVIRHCD